MLLPGDNSKERRDAQIYGEFLKEDIQLLLWKDRHVENSNEQDAKQVGCAITGQNRKHVTVTELWKYRL